MMHENDIPTPTYIKEWFVEKIYRFDEKKIRAGEQILSDGLGTFRSERRFKTKPN